MNKEFYSGNLRLQALSLPKMVKEQLKILRTNLTTIGLTNEICQKVNQIIITGSGDCLSATKIAMPALTHYLQRFGTNILFNTPLELSRFQTLVRENRNDISPKQTLIIAISFYGTPSRIIELLTKARHLGCRTLLITNCPSSPAAKLSDLTYDIQLPEYPVASPGCRSYLGILLATILLGAYINELRENTDSTSLDLLCQNIELYAEKYSKVMDDLDNTMFRIAQKVKDCTRFEAIADGIAGSGVSSFYAAKIVESVGAFSCHTTSSEWRIENQHIINPAQISSSIFADINEHNHDSIRKTAKLCVETGRKTILYCNTALDLWNISDQIDICQLPSAPADYEYLYHVFNFIPGCLLASYLTAFHGESYFRNYADGGTQR